MFRSISSLFIACSLLLGTVAFADGKDDCGCDTGCNLKDRNYALSIGLDELAVGTGSLYFEAGVNDFFSVVVNGYGAKADLLSQTKYLYAPYTGFVGGLNLAFKYHVTGKTLARGFYFSPAVGVFYGQAGAANQFGANWGGYFGYDWALDNGFFLDAFAGLTSFWVNGQADAANAGYLQPSLDGGLNIGYAW